MKKNILIIGCLSFFVFSFMMSCQKFDDLGDASLQFDGDYATSLLTATMQIEDIVGELDSSTTVELDQDGLLHLIYRGDFTQRSSTDIFASIPFFPIVVPDSFFSFPYAAPNGMVLEFVRLKSATVSFACESPFTEDITLEIELPEVLDPITGETYKHFSDIPYDGEAPSSGAGAMDLTGWHLTPDNGNINIRYTAILPDGTRVLLENFFMFFQDFEASYLQGYLGQEVYDLPRDTIIIDFFDRWISGGVSFAEPSINVDVENSFGLPVRSVSNFMSILNLDGSILELQSDALEGGVDFAYPALDEVGESKFTSFTLDNTNSNIVDIFANRPVAVDYDLDALGNPDSDQAIVGFATDSSFFRINVFVDLPVYVTARNFTLRSDVEINDNDLGDDFDFADYITLKIVSDNNIPIDLGLQLYFEDENGIILDSLFDTSLDNLLPNNAIIKAAAVDANGYSISTTHHEIEIEMPKEKFNAFLQMKNLGLVTVLNNAPDDVVRFIDKDDVTIKIGVKAGITK
ncbi:MAG: hypothetical protein ACI94Y_002164 [Maribacter sp.]|jgi:hypothetical protein